jgi:NADH-quinone oxidoreductase subunit G
MISIKLNTKAFVVKSGYSLLETCKYLGIVLPRFCYHEILPVAGNCRMCLVEIEGLEKPVASCAIEVENNMSIYTQSIFVKKSRENILEVLLFNHPLDCPICDQAGECDLQDQTKEFGLQTSRFFINKRGVVDKYCGILIKTIMTRCIHCTRCVRFSSIFFEKEYFGTLKRGTNTEIGSYNEENISSEISGNVIDLCPVGALTSKPYAFKARPWELSLLSNIDTTDGLNTKCYINKKENEIYRITPSIEEFGGLNLISDKNRFFFDFLKYNRINALYEKNNNSKEYTKISWSYLFSQINKKILEKKSILFLVNNDIDLNTLLFLKQLKYITKSKISIRNTHLSEKNNNILINKSFSIDNEIKKNSIDYFFLLSLNLHIESALLNAKIRLAYHNSNTKIISFGNSCAKDKNISYVNLDISTTLRIFEGKNKFFTKTIIESKNSILLIGESLASRTTSIKNLIACAQLFFNIKIFKIKNSSNANSGAILNIKTLSAKKLTENTLIFSIESDDIFILRKFLSNYKKNVLWFNSHGAKIASDFKYIIPVLTVFEKESYYINFENKIQKSFKSVDFIKDIKSTTKVLECIFNLKVHVLEQLTYLNYLNELIKFPEKHVNKTSIFLNAYNFFDDNFYEKKYIYNYPIKIYTYDYYLTNKNTKNSSIMYKSSEINKKVQNNFK